MAQGCISVIEMTVMLGFVQQNPGRMVVPQDKNLPRLYVLQAGQGFVAVGALCHATFSRGEIC